VVVGVENMQPMISRSNITGFGFGFGFVPK
jgi:hypothetical protein